MSPFPRAAADTIAARAIPDQVWRSQRDSVYRRPPTKVCAQANDTMPTLREVSPRSPSHIACRFAIGHSDPPADAVNLRISRIPRVQGPSCLRQAVSVKCKRAIGRLIPVVAKGDKL